MRRPNPIVLTAGERAFRIHPGVSHPTRVYEYVHGGPTLRRVRDEATLHLVALALRAAVDQALAADAQRARRRRWRLGVGALATRAVSPVRRAWRAGVGALLAALR